MLAREQTSGPHHAFDASTQAILCGQPHPYTVYKLEQFAPAHPHACASCNALVELEHTGVLPDSALVPGETVAIQDHAGRRSFNVTVRQHQYVDLGFADSPFNRRRRIGHRLHLDVTDPAIEDAVREGLPRAARVLIKASVPLPMLMVDNVQGPTTIVVGSKPIKRLDVLLVHPVSSSSADGESTAGTP